MKVSQEEKFEFEQLQLEQTKIEAEKELKTHETEMQAKARSTSHTKQGNIPSIKLLKLELTRFNRHISNGKNFGTLFMQQVIKILIYKIWIKSTTLKGY